MRRAAVLALALTASAAHAGYACRDLSDLEGRRGFQAEPCGPGYVHDPLPVPPLIREAPRLPDGVAAGAGDDPKGDEPWNCLFSA